MPWRSHAHKASHHSHYPSTRRRWVNSNCLGSTRSGRIGSCRPRGNGPQHPFLGLTSSGVTWRQLNGLLPVHRIGGRPFALIVCLGNSHAKRARARQSARGESLTPVALLTAVSRAISLTRGRPDGPETPAARPPAPAARKRTSPHRNYRSARFVRADAGLGDGCHGHVYGVQRVSRIVAVKPACPDRAAPRRRNAR